MKKSDHKKIIRNTSSAASEVATKEDIKILKQTLEQKIDSIKNYDLKKLDEKFETKLAKLPDEVANIVARRVKPFIIQCQKEGEDRLKLYIDELTSKKSSVYFAELIAAYEELKQEQKIAGHQINKNTDDIYGLNKRVAVLEHS